MPSVPGGRATTEKEGMNWDHELHRYRMRLMGNPEDELFGPVMDDEPDPDDYRDNLLMEDEDDE